MNLTPNEVLIISLVALVALGPKQLPEAVRRVAKGFADLRRFSSRIRSELDSAVEGEVERSHDEELRRQGEPLPSPESVRNRDSESGESPPS
ncbi:MAG: twin-arginine translocase TatA/TatE family subunit [Actinomycetota bacterium]|nr:twin-arginine translocase TatA/TatE family subunit [Pseudomonadales bacterium]MEC8922954.1 twin-arginine translocase TatA/TatE family subunit [Actinomycetota bacterium]MEC9316240.1 twin-arginine translocase TatA/TatE family subunit [Actinomycetota bacterium]MED5551938.1 twin-arginine translocase TatA/TatE family subunit [Actinomycetota bacterium]MEE3187595.1 twin-arginine translocase TatA/TatE family subunit [Actinomycetota bacterium]